MEDGPGSRTFVSVCLTLLTLQCLCVGADSPARLARLSTMPASLRTRGTSLSSCKTSQGTSYSPLDTIIRFAQASSPSMSKTQDEGVSEHVSPWA
jgi:hypothetical protein